MDDGIVLRADLERGIIFPLEAPGPTAVPPGGPAPVAPLADHEQVVPGGTLAPDALLPTPSPLAIPPSPSGVAALPPTPAGGQQAQEPPGASGPPGVPLSAGDAREGSAVWTVQPGDSLWALAARGVGAARSDDRRIGPYWVQVVAENRERVASGDPDLIRPGEAIVMPPLTPPGTDVR
jgi:nucleoid-associated protein YgaU